MIFTPVGSHHIVATDEAGEDNLEHTHIGTGEYLLSENNPAQSLATERWGLSGCGKEKKKKKVKKVKEVEEVEEGEEDVGGGGGFALMVCSIVDPQLQ